MIKAQCVLFIKVIKKVRKKTKITFTFKWNEVYFNNSLN